MAPRLALSKIEFISDMLKSNELTISQIANAAECSKRSVYSIRSNLELFGSAKALLIRAGRPRILTPLMLEALCDHLLIKPTLYLGELADILLDEFGIDVPDYNISRALASIGWSKKTARQRAKERNPDLRDKYVHEISEFHSYQLIFVDESGCDKRAGIRRTGWSPLGITPVQVSKFHRDKRYQILPAYDQDGIASLGFSKVQQMPSYSRISWRSSSNTARSGLMKGLLLSWTTHPFTIQRELKRCA